MHKESSYTFIRTREVINFLFRHWNETRLCEANCVKNRIRCNIGGLQRILWQLIETIRTRIDEGLICGYGICYFLFFITLKTTNLYIGSKFRRCSLRQLSHSVALQRPNKRLNFIKYIHKHLRYDWLNISGSQVCEVPPNQLLAIPWKNNFHKSSNFLHKVSERLNSATWTDE